MGDTSLSKNFNERAARTGEAYMVLSSGNKGCVSRPLPAVFRRAACETDPPFPPFSRAARRTVTEGKADKKRK